ncbi:MAG: tetratricopeptide repeat protein, partial [Gallionella sp.]|nr:tetratricopeptide repeat protein [Gallionella sp.]
MIFCLAGSGLSQAADEDAFMGEFHPPSEKSLGQGQSALWTLPNVATQYHPLQPTPAMQEALQAQQDGHFLDALIRLDDAGKSEPVGADVQVEITLLRASFLLQGNQSDQALALLTPLRSNNPHGADAYALMVMAQLQSEKKLTLETASNGQDFQGGLLSHLAQSYALQSLGHLTEASDVMHAFNTLTPQSAVALAREAELALTLDRIASARYLVTQAQAVDAAQPYVIAVSGLAYLIDGKPQQAKAAFATALKRDTKDAKALLGLGLAEIKMGNFMAGQKMLQAANEAEPNNALILTYLGRSQQQSGQTEAARASWRNAQQTDPKDPTPWLYQAQAELQANHLVQARESLRQAQARMGYRSVYRGDLLLKDDEQLLQANLAEIQRQSGLDEIAFQTLSDSVGEKNSSNLRNQAEVLQGQRFGESARRSLLLQSLFNEKPGSLPPELDIYGDGAGHTGASVPQHGVISGLEAQQASYNNYDELFSKRTTLAADATIGSKNSNGEQVRLGLSNNTLGVSLAGLQFKTDGFGLYQNLDNRVAQGVVQWQPTKTMQAFMSYETTHSKHGEIDAPADPMANGVYHQYEDTSGIMRLGLRHSQDDNRELRVLFSHQQTDQIDSSEWMSDFLPPSNLNYTGPPGSNIFAANSSSVSSSAELQYRRSGSGYATQWGMSAARAKIAVLEWYSTFTSVTQQAYVNWQQTFNSCWQLETGLAWG